MKAIESILSEYKKERDPYKLGFDCGLNGANMENCHCSIFSSPENTKKWEQGKRDGDAKRLRRKP